MLEDEDTIEDEHLGRVYEYRLRESVVLGEGVDGALDALSLLELADMLDHHIRIEGVRMVVVELGALLEAQFVMGLIVVVVTERGDVLLDKGLLQLAYEGRLTRGRASSDTNYRSLIRTHRDDIMLIVIFTCGGR